MHLSILIKSRKGFGEHFGVEDKTWSIFGCMGKPDFTIWCKNTRMTFMYDDDHDFLEHL